MSHESEGSSPARILRVFNAAVRKGSLDVEIDLGIRWITLQRSGFKLTDFGGTTLRSRRLGKWIVSLPRDEIVGQAQRLLDGLHAGRIKAAKFTNVANVPGREGKIVVYCLDEDRSVEKWLAGFGWAPRWKSNSQTYRENRHLSPRTARRGL